MKLLELFEMLKDKSLDGDVKFRVDCPQGGNSLPCEVDIIVNADCGTCIILSPEDGVAFEVFDREDEDDEKDEDKGPTVVIEYPSIGRTYATNDYGVYEYSVHDENSVLAGEERRVFIDCFKTLAEAQASFPNAEFHGEGEDVINES
jgi:hypothetical protein